MEDGHCQPGLHEVGIAEQCSSTFLGFPGAYLPAPAAWAHAHATGSGTVSQGRVLQRVTARTQGCPHSIAPKKIQ